MSNFLQFSLSVAGFWPLGTGFSPMPVHVGFLVDKIALGRFYVRVLQFFPVSIKQPRLRWSRDSVLAFITQVCGFKPGRGRPIFRAKKSSVKPSVPCRRFAACKRSLNLRGSRNLGKITIGHLSRTQFHLSLLGSLASLRTEAPGG